jgi:hypothetical protein
VKNNLVSFLIKKYRLYFVISTKYVSFFTITVQKYDTILLFWCEDQIYALYLIHLLLSSFFQLYLPLIGVALVSKEVSSSSATTAVSWLATAPPQLGKPDRASATTVSPLRPSLRGDLWLTGLVSDSCFSFLSDAGLFFLALTNLPPLEGTFTLDLLAGTISKHDSKGNRTPVVGSKEEALCPIEHAPIRGLRRQEETLPSPLLDEVTLISKSSVAGVLTDEPAVFADFFGEGTSAKDPRRTAGPLQSGEMILHGLLMCRGCLLGIALSRGWCAGGGMNAEHTGPMNMGFVHPIFNMALWF